MIYEEERTIDEMIDDIVRTGNEDESVRGEKTEAAGDGHKAPRLYLNRCKDCRTTFESPYVGGKYCPACKRKRISEGQKARQARERQERAAGVAANGRQVKTRNEEPQKGAETMENSEKTAQEAWNALATEESAASCEANTEASPDPAPERMTTAEIADKLAGGLKREPGDVVLALYQAARDVARAAGIQTRVLIETMYELDCTLAHVGSV